MDISTTYRWHFPGSETKYDIYYNEMGIYILLGKIRIYQLSIGEI
jgi:hypothetical protein